MEFKTGNLLVVLPPAWRSETPLLKKKLSWIMEKHETIRRAIEEASNGLHILGRPFQIRVPADGVPRIDFERGELFCDPNQPVQVKCLELLLRKHLKKELEERLQRFGKALGVHPSRIFVRKQKSKWASCSSSGNLSFNLRLIAVPPHVLDYVVLHEMLHLKYPKHDEDFWMKVSQFFQNYRQLERDLLRFWFSTAQHDWLFNLQRPGAGAPSSLCAS